MNPVAFLGSAGDCSQNTLPGRARTPVRAVCELRMKRRAEDCPPYQVDRPQVRTQDGFVRRRTGGNNVDEIALGFRKKPGLLRDPQP